MTRLVLDTNRYSDFARGAPDVVRNLEEADEVLVPFVVLAELHAGFRYGTRQRENEQTLERFLSWRGVGLLYPDPVTVDQYAELYASLRRRGVSIPPHDLWIAALALQHDLTLYARDRHFDHLPQLKRI